jgi:hypothetical protein
MRIILRQLLAFGIAFAAGTIGQSEAGTFVWATTLSDQFGTLDLATGNFTPTGQLAIWCCH